MTNQKSIRYYSVAYMGSYVTYATQDWPLGAPTERYHRLIEAAKRNKHNRNNKFEGSLSVSSSGIHLSVTGSRVTAVDGAGLQLFLTGTGFTVPERRSCQCGGNAAVSSTGLPTVNYFCTLIFSLFIQLLCGDENTVFFYN
jgi:hypothetical protein